jgi:hypothetical protein
VDHVPNSRRVYCRTHVIPSFDTITILYPPYSNANHKDELTLQGGKREKRRKDGGECAVSDKHYTLKGEGVGLRKVNCAEGSQAVPARPSGKGTLIAGEKFGK